MTDHTQRPTATIYQFPARKAVRREATQPQPARQANSAERAAQGIIDGPCWYHDEAIAAALPDDRRR